MATIVNRPKPSASAMRAGPFSLAARHCAQQKHCLSSHTHEPTLSFCFLAHAGQSTHARSAHQVDD